MPYNTITSTQSNKNTRNERTIRYIDKDFTNFKDSLIEFSKTYFPDTYTDFTSTSPGMMFIEMASYVGDVLSFYQDNQIQETFTQFARQNPNLYQLAYMMGYKPKATSAAIADLEIFQTVNATIDGTPNYSEAVSIPSNTIVESSIRKASSFIIQDFCDFSISSSTDPTEVSVFSTSGATPTKFLLKKTRQAMSATTSSITFNFGSYEKFPTVTIDDSNIISITDCVDSNGNSWYEVPYLAQETVERSNINPTSGTDTPYLLSLLRTPRRFVTRFISPTKLQIQFGAGGATPLSDDTIVPNPSNVGQGGANLQVSTAFAPSNFVFTNTYGTAPTNTSLTFTYLTGGGISSNAPANSLTNINTSGITGLPSSIATVRCNNPEAASGGGAGDTPDMIRENSLRMFGTQHRSVTQNDYVARAFSMPGIYGNIAKIYMEPEKIENLNLHARPSVLDMYVLSYDSNKLLTTPSQTLKTNLSTYLSQYRMINDTISVKNGFVVNIAVDFSIVLRPNYSGNQVLNKCISALKDYFDIDKWQINQPIFLTDIRVLLDKIEGVQTVKSIEISNKAGESAGYSKYFYDVKGATQNDTVFPSQDPCIFEVKYPNSDIRGSVTNF